MNTFPKGTARIQCPTCDNVLEYVSKSPINTEAEVSFLSIGINDIQDGKSPEETAEKVCDELKALDKLCPSAKICYSAMIAKKGTHLVGPVEGTSKEGQDPKPQSS